MVVPRRNAFHQDLQNPRAQTTVDDHCFIGGDEHFFAAAWALLSQTGIFNTQFPFRERNDSLLPSVPGDLAFGLAGLLGAGDLRDPDERRFDAKLQVHSPGDGRNGGREQITDYQLGSVAGLTCFLTRATTLSA